RGKQLQYRFALYPDAIPASHIYSGSIALALILFFLHSLTPVEHHSFFMGSRRPVSEACLRNYRIVPTTCILYVTQSRVNVPELIVPFASTLEKHHLTAFAPRQRWTLQGDFIFETVKVYDDLENVDQSSEVRWTNDRSTIAQTLWDSVERLDLILHSPNNLTWTVTLPETLKEASFHTAVAIANVGEVDPDSGIDGVNVVVSISSSILILDVHEQSVEYDHYDWIPMDIPLTEYAGKTITIQLGSTPGDNFIHDWLVFRHPYIDLVYDPDSEPASYAPIPPESYTLPQPGSNDYVADLQKWDTDNIDLSLSTPQEHSFEFEDGAPLLSLDEDLDLCIKHYSHFYLKMSTPENTIFTPGYVHEAVIFYEINHSGIWSPLLLPLWSDSEMHEYYYPIKLIGGRQQRLTGLRLQPMTDAPREDANWFKIGDFRL
ncbi:MAG TPA: hypothetical protein VJZ27_10875, partial [Aggregatilineales bacterium]|nr:hypothetical protein [Aggregatilineales bacterium]